MESDLERLIGQLESKVDSLSSAISLLLESNRELTNKIDDSSQRLHKRVNILSRKLVKHDVSIEHLLDRTDIQGKIVADLEATSERNRGRIDTNRRWAKVLLAVAGMAELWHYVGEKLFKK